MPCAAAFAAKPGRDLRRGSRNRALTPASNAKLNIVWGNNATVTNLHLVRQLHGAPARRGASGGDRPLRSKIAEQADLHLAPKPGTDVFLGFALAVELEGMGAHDRAFIDEHVSGYKEYMAARAHGRGEAPRMRGRAEEIRTLAALDGAADPLVLAPGNGLERPQRWQRTTCSDRPAGLLGKLDATSGFVLGAGKAFPKTPAQV